MSLFLKSANIFTNISYNLYTHVLRIKFANVFYTLCEESVNYSMVCITDDGVYLFLPRVNVLRRMETLVNM